MTILTFYIKVHLEVGIFSTARHGFLKLAQFLVFTTHDFTKEINIIATKFQ